MTGQIEDLDYPGQVRATQKLGLLTASEAKQLLHVHELVMEIISVDDFAPEELTSAMPRKPKQSKKTPHAA